MELKYFCNKALETLQQYKRKDRDAILLQAVKERLDKSFETYNHELELSLGYLKRRNELNVMRKVNQKKR